MYNNKTKLFARITLNKFNIDSAKVTLYFKNNEDDESEQLFFLYITEVGDAI